MYKYENFRWNIPEAVPPCNFSLLFLVESKRVAGWPNLVAIGNKPWHPVGGDGGNSSGRADWYSLNQCPYIDPPGLVYLY